MKSRNNSKNSKFKNKWRFVRSGLANGRLLVRNLRQKSTVEASIYKNRSLSAFCDSKTVQLPFTFFGECKIRFYCSIFFQLKGIKYALLKKKKRSPRLICCTSHFENTINLN